MNHETFGTTCCSGNFLPTRWQYLNVFDFSKANTKNFIQSFDSSSLSVRMKHEFRSGLRCHNVTIIVVVYIRTAPNDSIVHRVLLSRLRLVWNELEYHPENSRDFIHRVSLAIIAVVFLRCSTSFKHSHNIKRRQQQTFRLIINCQIWSSLLSDPLGNIHRDDLISFLFFLIFQNNIQNCLHVHKKWGHFFLLYSAKLFTKWSHHLQSDDQFFLFRWIWLKLCERCIIISSIFILFPILISR